MRRRTLGKEEKRAAAPLRSAHSVRPAVSRSAGATARRSPTAISRQLLFLDLKQPRGRVPLLDQCYPLMFSALCSCTIVRRLTSDGVTGGVSPALQRRGPDAGWTPSFSLTRPRTVPGEGEKDERDFLIWRRDGRDGEAPFRRR